MARFSPIVTLSLLLLLTACGPTPTRPQAPKVVEKPDQAALALEDRGDFYGAASAYQNLAGGAPPADQNRYKLRAMELFLKAGFADRAEAIYAVLQEDALTADQVLRRRLAGAEARKVSQDWNGVIERLPPPPPSQAPIEGRERYWRLRIEALENLGYSMQATEDRVALDRDLLDPAAKADNQTRILETLAALPRTELETRLAQSQDPARGWYDLATILSRFSLDPGRMEADLLDWRQRYPTHPADIQIARTLIDERAASFRPPAQIALLLPQQGNFALPAEAIRDGFLAAYYRVPRAERPRLRIYDSVPPQNVWSVYQQAIRDGAEMVVGPLDKKAVEELARSGELQVPVLALNRMEPRDDLPGNLIQFGLIPEDEAEQIANSAWQAGKQRALALVPTGAWGDRVAKRFQARWEQLGGRFLERQSFDPQASDFNKPIQELLDIDLSEARKAALRETIGTEFEFEPRRRQDADFITLVAVARQARIIKPQLAFNRASRLPVLATSQVNEGKDEPNKNTDLDGLEFCDLPWLLDPASEWEPGARRLVELWPQRERFLRLYALGADAYQLTSEIGRMRGEPDKPFEGLTGRLYLGAGGILQRELPWAQFRNGTARYIGYSLPTEP
ncbi:MAG: penicillin-binding protein activator [Chromatiales bacterium]|nr:penicillin-binding protein activator [Chromatiales bacterium]